MNFIWREPQFFGLMTASFRKGGNPVARGATLACGIPVGVPVTARVMRTVTTRWHGKLRWSVESRWAHR